MRCWGQWEIFLKVQLTPVEVLVKWLLILFVDYLRALPCWACSHLSQTTVEFFSILHYSKMEIIRQRPVEGFDSASSFAIGITKQFLRLFLLGNRCLDRVSSARFYYSLSRENKCQVCNPRPRRAHLAELDHMVSHLSNVGRPILILFFVLLGQKLWVRAGFQSHGCLFQMPGLMVMILL